MLGNHRVGQQDLFGNETGVIQPVVEQQTVLPPPEQLNEGNVSSTTDPSHTGADRGEFGKPAKRTNS